MFGSFFLANRVSSWLFEMGWSPQTIPLDRQIFLKLSDALKANGYGPERAARLWDRVFRGDSAATKELRVNTGAFGIVSISEDGDWR